MAAPQSLLAWQHAKRLAVACAKVANAFPGIEQRALADQLRRAAYSVPLNIAEGAARRGLREYRRYLDTARASLSEVETCLAIASELGYIPTAAFQEVEAIRTETAKTLFGLLRAISKRLEAPS